MIQILSEGEIENEDALVEMTLQFNQVIIPNDDAARELTHWYAIKQDGEEMLYVGTPETFAQYIDENGGSESLN